MREFIPQNVRACFLLVCSVALVEGLFIGCGETVLNSRMTLVQTHTQSTNRHRCGYIRVHNQAGITIKTTQIRQVSM